MKWTGKFEGMDARTRCISGIIVRLTNVSAAADQLFNWNATQITNDVLQIFFIPEIWLMFPHVFIQLSFGMWIKSAHGSR